MDDDYKIGFFEAAKFDIRNFFSDWIYPAHKLRNALFNRYDIVKMGELKRCEYCDDVARMLHANMELVRHFIEDEKPEETVYWYLDEKGNDVGHKYGENSKHEVLFPAYKGQYILDIVKEIYDWWTVERHEKQKEYDYLLDFWIKYFVKLKGRPLTEEERVTHMNKVLSVEELNEISVMTIDTSQCPKCLGDFEGEEVKWSIVDKHLEGDRNNLFEENFLLKTLSGLENEIFMDEQKYLHLCIEVRPYLWT